MTHIMLDLETFGTVPGSSILSIGACVFDENGPSEDPAKRFHVHIKLDSMKNSDPATVLWWMERDSPARLYIVEGQKKARLDYIAVNEFLEWIATVEPVQKQRVVWGKGPSFDCSMLANFLRIRCSPELPSAWRYSNERCVRTLAAAFPHIAEPAREGVHHGALDDALHQARHIGSILKELAAR